MSSAEAKFEDGGAARDPRRSRFTDLLELAPRLVRATATLLCWVALSSTMWTHQPYVAAAAATYLVCTCLEGIVDALREHPKPEPRRLKTGGHPDTP